MIHHNDVYSSSDMYNWNLISPNDPSSTSKWSPRSNPQVFYFNNKYWVMGGVSGGGAWNDNNEVWSSSDGINWVKLGDAPFEFTDYKAVVFNNAIYVIDTEAGVSHTNVWSSTDGINWSILTTSTSFSPRIMDISVVFNGKIYVLGGEEFVNGQYNNLSDVWSSTDGITWTQVINSAPWGPLVQSKALVYNNKLFIIGGTLGPAGNNIATQNIWSSFDGLTWNLVSSNLPTQYENTMIFRDGVVANGKMWVASSLPTTPQSKLWSSSDGVTWTESCVQLPWQPRTSYRMVSNGGTPANTPDPCVVTTPSITVVSPNGNEVFTGGQTINSTWTTTNVPSANTVALSLEVYDLNNNPIGNLGLVTSPNDGSEIVTIPTISQIRQSNPALFGNVTAGKHFTVIAGAYDNNNQFVYDYSDDLFTITDQSSSTCTINSFTVPASTTLASGMSVTGSWSSNCNHAYVGVSFGTGGGSVVGNGGSSGTYTFSLPGVNLSTVDSTMELYLIVSNDTDTASQTKSVPITDVTNPSPNQCDISSFTATPDPVPTGTNQATLSWVAPTGCLVYLSSSTPSAGGLIFGNITNPGTYYFPSTGSVNVTLAQSSTYKLNAIMPGPNYQSVSSTKTIDVKVESSQVCNQTGVGSFDFNLNGTPSSMVVSTGSNNVEFTRFNISNNGSTDICGLNGIQIGSNNNANNFMTNIRAIDVSTGIQVGQAVMTLYNNGSYYYEWIFPNNSIPLSVGSTKTIKLIADVPNTASTGTIQLGVFGVNFSPPGASGPMFPFIGNTMTIQ